MHHLYSMPKDGSHMQKVLFRIGAHSPCSRIVLLPPSRMLVLPVPRCMRTCCDPPHIPRNTCIYVIEYDRDSNPGSFDPGRASEPLDHGSPPFKFLLHMYLPKAAVRCQRRSYRGEGQGANAPRRYWKTCFSEFGLKIQKVVFAPYPPPSPPPDSLCLPMTKILLKGLHRTREPLLFLWDTLYCRGRFLSHSVHSNQT
jgi:hypothetical protein